MLSLQDCNNDVLRMISKNLSKHDSFNLAISLNLTKIDGNQVYVDDLQSHGSMIHIADLTNESDSQPEGFCYLKVVYKKYQALKYYGSYLRTSELLNCLLMFNCVDSEIYHRNVGIRDIVHFSLNHDEGCHTLRYQHMRTNVVLPLTNSLLSRVRHHDEWRFHMLQGTRIGGTGGFTLSDITLSQATVEGFHCPPPVHYVSRGKATGEVSVIRDGHMLIIQTEDISTSLAIDSDTLKKIPHEYVASCLQESTDMELSNLGITGEESVLTPDFIDPINKVTLELGTNQSDTLTSLYNDFDGKVRKYQYLLEPIGCTTFYLIVGINNIITNLNLSSSTVDDLCARYRIGLFIKSLVSDLISDTGISDEDSENIKIAKAIFSEMGEGNLSDTYDYDTQQILSAASDPTDSDDLHVSKVINTCFKSSKIQLPSPRSTLDSYLKQLEEFDCRSDTKRVTNCPLVLYSKSGVPLPDLDPGTSNMSHGLTSLWIAAKKQIENMEETTDYLDDILNRKYPKLNHKWKKESTFNPHLDSYAKEELALSGVGAKAMEINSIRVEKEKNSKRGFSPNTNTVDINDFIYSNLLSESQNTPRISKNIIKIIQKSKESCTNGAVQQSNEMFKSIVSSKLIGYCEMISEIFVELAINYKHWTKGNGFMIKRTVSGIYLLIKNTGSHMFVSMAFPRDDTEILDCGRIGPTLFASNKYYFTDFSSFNEPTIEHFVKTGPYIASLVVHLLSKFRLNYNDLQSKKLNCNINFILLLFLNNKLDSEELLTSQRYLFMKLLEDATQDPYVFVDRLPSVLRSRLSVYILSKTINLMDYYNDHRIIKIPKKENDITIYEYLNIRSLITGDEISIEEKINEFYYGYVVSKERARGSDRTYKILKKILQEEYKFRDSVKTCFKQMINGPETYLTDPSVMRVTLHFFKKRLSEMIGNDFKRIHQDAFAYKLSKTSFIDLATLKASSRNHTREMEVPVYEDKKRSEVFDELRKMNKDEAKKRPKVLEALIDLIKVYKDEAKRNVRHVMQLIPWCLGKLEKKGYFDSDIFPKPQHGGDREIHVLELMARIVQYTIELISKTFCAFFPSEVLTHPETKARFVKDHYKETSNAFKSYFVISKSADASKWCQRHHTSHFASMLTAICHPSLKNFIMRSLRLWSTKNISFPMQFVATLLVNERTLSSDKTFIRFRNEFYKGGDVIKTPFSNKMEIKSGMMQGILHYTSSLYHTMVQEVSRLIVMRMAIKLGNPVVCTIVQGSDDSGMMLGVSLPITPKIMSSMYMLLRFKEEFSQYLSIYWNVCKSSIGTIDLIEFNSEWYLRHSIIKPTFRWISACMELNITDRFIDRFRIFYNVLSQCLEGGASTLECAVIQMCQAWLHYMMIGIKDDSLGNCATEHLILSKNPSLGYFMFDYDICCALPGIDFNLYCLFKDGHYVPDSLFDESANHFDYDGSDKVLMSRDLKSVKMRFGKLYLWKSLVDRISLISIEEALQKIEDDPTILFSNQYSWEDCESRMILKIFEPGVKESINNVSSLLRMMASSAFILDRPCFTTYDKNGESSNDSLLYLLSEYNKNRRNIKSIDQKRIFPLYNEYQSFYNTITQFSTNNIKYKQYLRKTSKVKLRIFSTNMLEHDIMGLCRKAWNLGGRVALSTRQFNTIWSQTQLQYPFLKDTLKETKQHLNMTTLEVKTMIEKMTQKNRDIVLMDSSGKESNVELSMTRIYWPDVKIRTTSEGGITECLRLKSFLFSLTTFWLSKVSTENIAKRAISLCHSLDMSYKDVPVRFRKLKTLYDWTKSVDKISLISQIKSQKQSAIGFFSQPQKRQHGIPTGSGVWIGQVVGIPCHIELYDNKVKLITIKYLSDLKLLGKSLSVFLKEIGNSEGTGKIKSNLWLTESGRLVTKHMHDEVPIPIKIDQYVKADVITAMEELPWKFEINNTTLRLLVCDNVDNAEVKYTILSESLNSKDWNPDLTINSPDLLLNFWNNNVPATMMDFEDNLSSQIPETRSNFLKFMKTLKNHHTLSGWDFTKFRSKALTQLTRGAAISTMINQDTTSEESKQEIDSLLSKMFDYTTQFLSKTSSWADEVIDFEPENETNEEEFISDQTLEGIKGFADNLKDISFDEDDETSSSNSWFLMPFSNRFFSNIEKLCVIQTGSEIKNVLEDIKSGKIWTVDGTLGKMLSLLSGEFVFKGSDNTEIVLDTASRTSRQLDTIISEGPLTESGIKEIESSLEQLNAMIPHLSGLALDEVNKIIQRKRQILVIHTSKPQRLDMEMIPYNEFMTYISAVIFENGLSRFSDYDVESDLKLSLIKVELGDNLKESLRDARITDREHTIMREYINKSVVSPYLIDVLTESYGLRFNFDKYYESGLIKDITLF